MDAYDKKKNYHEQHNQHIDARKIKFLQSLKALSSDADNDFDPEIPSFFIEKLRSDLLSKERQQKHVMRD